MGPRRQRTFRGILKITHPTTSFCGFPSVPESAGVPEVAVKEALEKQVAFFFHGWVHNGVISLFSVMAFCEYFQKK